MYAEPEFLPDLARAGIAPRTLEGETGEREGRPRIQASTRGSDRRRHYEPDCESSHGHGSDEEYGFHGAQYAVNAKRGQTPRGAAPVDDLSSCVYCLRLVARSMTA